MNEDTNEDDGSNEVSDVHDTNLTLTRHNGDGDIFNADNDVVISDHNDIIFNNNLEESNSEDTCMVEAIEEMRTNNSKRRIIPSLKTRLATDVAIDVPLKDSSLQQATQAIQSNHQVPVFTTKLDEHDTQGWEQVEHPKRRKSEKISNLQDNPDKIVEDHNHRKPESSRIHGQYDHQRQGY